MVGYWNELVVGLKTYRNVTGKNDFIPVEYVIPSTPEYPSHLHGSRLGYLLEKSRSAYHQRLLTQFQVDLLETYQMHWTAESYRWNFIYFPAIDMYKKIFGHIVVPVLPPFIIPSEKPWNEKVWGMNLTVRVQNWRNTRNNLSRQVVHALNERNFIWDIREETFQAITIPALIKYQEMKGNLLVPQTFHVPANAYWPVIAHGFPLGPTVRTMRSQKGNNTTRDELLTNMGFIWDPIRSQFEKMIMPACQIYARENGCLNTMPITYKIPESEDLPIACWGLKLGEKLHQWRSHQVRPDLMEELKALGFKPDPIEFSSQDLTKLLEALDWFYHTYGYKERVKKCVKISLPEDHPTLPGLQLGPLFRRAKKWNEMNRFSEAERKQLEVYPTWNSRYQSIVYPLMIVYYNLHGNLHVPYSFQVPSSSPWPTWSWQQKLGRNTDSIRTGSLYLSDEEKDFLESMDFKWGPKGRTPQHHMNSPNQNEPSVT